jgi:DNA-binding MarR family transcriptional regulator
MNPKQPMTTTTPDPAAAPVPDLAIERIVDAFQAMMQRQMRHHATEMSGIDVTMAQAKALYLLVAAGELRMSALAGGLGVTSSTATGLVDRLVELGLAERHDDTGDRRHVVISATSRAATVLERFRELNAAAIRHLLGYIEPADLPVIERSILLMLDATDRAAADDESTPVVDPTSPSRGEHP